MNQWNRRQFLSGLLTAVGAQIAVAPVAQAHGQPPAPAPGPVVPRVDNTPAVTEGTTSLREELPEGTTFGRWRVVSVHPVRCGAVPVVVETRSGERFQVDILSRDRRQGARRGIAQTHNYALYLSNTGRGAKPTPEEHGLGVIWLAALLRAREIQAPRASLITLRERLLRFPAGHFDAIRQPAATNVG